MVYGERSFLFTGDCEKERLEELLEQKEFDLCHNVLKVPHHGRKGKNSEEFLKAVSPEIAVITCSEDKPADDGILRMLDGMGTEVTSLRMARWFAGAMGRKSHVDIRSIRAGMRE